MGRQISVFDPARKGPCYQCIFPEKPLMVWLKLCRSRGFCAVTRCDWHNDGGRGDEIDPENGGNFDRVMLIYDAHFGETRQIRLNKRTDCPICSGQT